LVGFAKIYPNTAIARAFILVEAVQEDTFL